MKKLIKFIPVVAVAALMASCSMTSRTMKEPNMRVEFQKEDFTISAQVTGEATETKIIGIDFQRLFKKEGGATTADGGMMALPSLSSIPVIGGFIGSKCQSYALYDMMQKNAGYDVVMYPQFETKTTGIPVLFTKTTCKATARLAKIK
jgi:hypothetical protein